MKEYKFKLTFTEELLGTASNDPEIHDKFIASCAPDAPSRKQEIAALGKPVGRGGSPVNGRLGAEICTRRQRGPRTKKFGKKGGRTPLDIAAAHYHRNAVGAHLPQQGNLGSVAAVEGVVLCDDTDAPHFVLLYETVSARQPTAACENEAKGCNNCKCFDKTAKKNAVFLKMICIYYIIIKLKREENATMKL